MSGQKIVLPGVGEVPLQRQEPGVIELLQVLGQLIHLVDILLQVQLRQARGWDIEDIIKDMGLTVPPVGTFKGAGTEAETAGD